MNRLRPAHWPSPSIAWCSFRPAVADEQKPAAEFSRPALPSATSRPSWAWSSPAIMENSFTRRFTMRARCGRRFSTTAKPAWRSSASTPSAFGVPASPRSARRSPEQCGIAPDHVMISASHSHSAGPTVMVLPGEYRRGAAADPDIGLRKVVAGQCRLSGPRRARDRRGGRGRRCCSIAGPLRRRRGHGERRGFQSPFPHAQRPDGDPSRGRGIPTSSSRPARSIRRSARSALGMPTAN